MKPKNFPYNKLPAGALQYTLLLSIILASLFLMLYLLLDLSNQLENRMFKKEKLHNYSENKLLSNEIIEKPLNERNYWGALSLVKSKKGNARDTVENVMLYEYFNEKEDEISLYLASRLMDLVLAGTTNIYGNVKIETVDLRKIAMGADLSKIKPKHSLKIGYVGGVPYQGNSPLVKKGRIMRSEKNLPELHTSFHKYLKKNYMANDKNYTLWDDQVDSIGVSFKKQTSNIFSSEPIRIDNKILKGNIKIQSLEKIEVARNNTLQDILLVAPMVEIQKGFMGKLHVIAKEITIEEDVILQYPSSLSVLHEDSSKNESVKVMEDAQINGKLIFIREDTAKKKLPNLQPHVVIEKGAEINGNLYVQGDVELRGNVKGQVHTDYFVVRSKGKLYLNHLFNVEIKPAEDKRVGLPFSDSRLKPSQWMY